MSGPYTLPELFYYNAPPMGTEKHPAPMSEEERERRLRAYSGDPERGRARGPLISELSRLRNEVETLVKEESQKVQELAPLPANPFGLRKGEPRPPPWTPENIARAKAISASYRERILQLQQRIETISEQLKTMGGKKHRKTRKSKKTRKSRKTRGRKV